MPTTLSLRLAFSLGLSALFACAPAGAHAPLAYAPADTAYAFASDGLPPEIAAAWIARDEALPALYLPLLERMLEQPAGQATDAAQDKRSRGLLKALRSELDGHGLAALFERWGLSQTPRAVLFGLGLRPVARIDLADPERFQGRLEALLRRAGMADAAAEIEGVRYWRFGGPGESSGPLLGLHDGQLVLSLLNSAEAEQAPLLRAVLGIETPASSLLESGGLDALNTRLGFTAGGSGFVDTRRLLAQLLELGPEAAREGNTHCRARADELLADWPRLSVGMAALSADAYRVRYVLEASPELATRLASLQGPTPGFGARAPAPLELAVGLQPAALQALLSKPGAALRGDCLAEIQLALWLSRLSDLMADPRLLVLSEPLSGLRLRIEDLRSPEHPEGPNLSGSLVALARSPEALHGLLSDPPEGMPLPEAGGPALPLDASDAQPEWLQVHIARGESTIALAFSAAAAAALPAELAAATTDAPALLELSLDGPYWAQQLREIVGADANAAALFGPTLHGLEQAHRSRFRLAATEFGLELEAEVQYR